MDITCPHCSHHGITPMAKFRAMPKSPATCANCGELSAIEQGATVKLILICTFLLMLIGPAMYAFIYQSLLFMLLPIVIACIAPLAIYYFVPLAPISTTEINHANKIYKIAIVLIIIYLIYKFYDIANSL